MSQPDLSLDCSLNYPSAAVGSALKTEVDPVGSDHVALDQDPAALAILFHELRTPLTTLTTLAKLLQLRIPPESEHFWIGSSLERECQHMRRLLEQFEQQHRGVNSSSEPVVLTPLEAITFVKELEPAFTTFVEDHQLQFCLRIEAQSPEIWIQSNPVLLRQVLNNLIDNACKYTAPPGSISLEISALPEEVIILIRDTGIGIPASDLERIFQPFYRVDPQLVAVAHPVSSPNGSPLYDLPGQGLGLAISRQLVSQMQGSLSVESQLGQGSVFQIRLPRISTS